VLGFCHAFEARELIIRAGSIPAAESSAVPIGEARERSALKLFLSYRRDDAAGWTGRLFDSLSATFDAGNIFMDVDSIPAGRMFEESIQRSVVNADVVLVIIGKNWAGAGEKGSRRIDQTGDFVRLEISTALENNKRMIPVLVDGVRPLLPEELPDDIKPLAASNAIELTHARWKYDTGRLIDAILDLDAIGRLVTSIRNATRYEALDSLQRIGEMMQGADAVARQRGFEMLQHVFCQPSTPAKAGTAPQDRAVRQAIWRCLRGLAVEPLAHCFANDELSGIDLYGVDFRGTQLKGLSFDGSFLVESDFSGADLEDASLRDCRIRNVNLTDARLDGADMTDADWFNSKGLTAEQLSVVKPGTLRLCATTVTEILESLPGDYAYPFSSWSRKLQQELHRTWKRAIPKTRVFFPGAHFN
jgi:hypothetical protein